MMTTMNRLEDVRRAGLLLADTRFRHMLHADAGERVLVTAREETMVGDMLAAVGEAGGEASVVVFLDSDEVAVLSIAAKHAGSCGSPSGWQTVGAGARVGMLIAATRRARDGELPIVFASAPTVCSRGAVMELAGV